MPCLPFINKLDDPSDVSVCELNYNVGQEESVRSALGVTPIFCCNVSLQNLMEHDRTSTCFVAQRRFYFAFVSLEDSTQGGS